jgi:chromate transport protein ChrA
VGYGWGVNSAVKSVSSFLTIRGRMRPTPAPPKLPALLLGWIFLRIGATAFGGLGTILPLIERELMTKRSMLTPAEVTEALTYTKLLPGSTGPQVVAYLGYRLGGW